MITQKNIKTFTNFSRRNAHRKPCKRFGIVYGMLVLPANFEAVTGDWK